MVNLTFGEQVKIILSRKGMTIKQLAEEVEKYTGKPMSRQNMTQRLGRDNFQEQDMRMIAEILGCPFTLSIMEPVEEVKPYSLTRDITVGELVEMTEKPAAESAVEEDVIKEATVEVEEVIEKPVVSMATEDVVGKDATSAEKEMLRKGVTGFFRKSVPVVEKKEKVEEVKPAQTQILGEINPYTRKEYETNSVRVHPKKIGYIQVYDRETHQWTDMTEWAFLGYQERLKKLLGKDYKPPIYLD